MKATKYNRCAFVQICFAIVCGYRRCIIKWKTNKRFFFYFPSTLYKVVNRCCLFLFEEKENAWAEYETK